MVDDKLKILARFFINNKIFIKEVKDLNLNDRLITINVDIPDNINLPTNLLITLTDGNLYYSVIVDLKEYDEERLLLTLNINYLILLSLLAILLIFSSLFLFKKFIKRKHKRFNYV